MKRITTTVLAIILWGASSQPLRAAEADEILRKVDAVRNPLSRFALDVQITSFHKQDSETWGTRVYGERQGHQPGGVRGSRQRKGALSPHVARRHVDLSAQYQPSFADFTPAEAYG